MKVDDTCTRTTAYNKSFKKLESDPKLKKMTKRKETTKKKTMVKKGINRTDEVSKVEKEK